MEFMRWAKNELHIVYEKLKKKINIEKNFNLKD